MAEWTHRLCERCWFDGPQAGWAAHQTPQGWPREVIPGLLHDGEHAGAYRMPTQVRDSEPGPCCGCGGMTITGIYFRADETTLLCRGRHDAAESWSRVGLRPSEE